MRTFDEDDAGVGRPREDVGQQQRRPDRGDDRAAGLLGRADRDRPPAIVPSSAARMTEGSVCRDDRLIANAPAIAASRTTSSILSPLRSACARVIWTRLDGRRDRGAEAGVTATFEADAVRLAQQAPAVQHVHRVARPEPQHAHGCAASSSGSVTTAASAVMSGA
jgi:hypothetical protein